LAAAKNRPLILAIGTFCATFVVLAGVFFWRRPMHPRAAKAPVILTPPPAVKSGGKAGGPAPEAAKPAAPPAATPVAAAPAAPVKSAAKPSAVRGMRKRRRAAPLAAAPASPAAAAPDQPDPPPAASGTPAAKKPDNELLLPGLPKKVRKLGSDAASDPAPAKAEGGTAPASADQLSAEKAKEQFSFCHQLLQQGRFGDFFDTCLCAGARSAAPYKGNRRAFIEKLSQDPASEIGSTVELVDARVDGDSASITAKWSKADGTSQRTEKWTIEDDLWCLKK
jgi:hypothetical protein